MIYVLKDASCNFTYCEVVADIVTAIVKTILSYFINRLV